MDTKHSFHLVVVVSPAAAAAFVQLVSFRLHY